MNERFATLILKCIDNYINMSSNKAVVTNNIVQQIKRNVTGIRFKSQKDPYTQEERIKIFEKFNLK